MRSTVRYLLILSAAFTLTVYGPQASDQTASAFRTLDDRFPPPRFSSVAEWQRRAAYLREHVLESAGLLPLPDKAPLNPVVFGEIKHDGYTVSKVYFESLPGFFVTGNLYRPIGDGPFPAVLSPHGHWAYGRLENTSLTSGPGRAINLARQGFVVFTYDMIGYNDSRQLTHTFGGRREALWGLSLSGLQLWNSIRSLDFLESLPYVERNALGATGESGGGTQTFLLSAVDDRVAVAVPVNMISLQMQGGCLCENPPGLRLDTTNVEIAAAIAPRPLLMVSATGDWTKETLESEYPAVRSIYALLDADDHVQAVRFTADHNYNKDSREAMYAWMARWLQHAPADTRHAESSFTPDPLPDLLVFHNRALPDGALDAEGLTAAWIAAAKRQIATTPLAVRRAALRHALAFEDSSAMIEAAAAALNRRVVLLAGDDASKMESALRAAGYSTRVVSFRPFDAEAAARVRHFETYNRTAASQRVLDIVTEARAHPGAALVASGDAALAGALAAAVAPVRLSVLDVGQFDTSRDANFLDRIYIAGLRRAGDFQTAADSASGNMVFHNTGARFDAGRARVKSEKLTPREIIALLR
ncbi:MAG: hypothetical protein DMF84_29440 [Acidobacteria bacterium]|nr:MAG: hypothetical protein DMF84_29440 [Acidobacteriota bacterium]